MQKKRVRDRERERVNEKGEQRRQMDYRREEESEPTSTAKISSRDLVLLLRRQLLLGLLDLQHLLDDLLLLHQEGPDDPAHRKKRKTDLGCQTTYSFRNSFRSRRSSADLSRTAPPERTPPYARLTVLRFLDNLDLVYSAGRRCGIWESAAC